MSEPAYMVGYSRPPVHTRFQKGRSGNPGGKPGPKKRLKQAFDEALGEALNRGRGELNDAGPAKAIEAFARKLVVDAVDGRSSAQRLVLSILDDEDSGAADEETLRKDQGEALRKDQGERSGASAAKNRNVDDEENEDDEDEGEDPFVFNDEKTRHALGARYDEFKRRFEWAMNKGTVDDLVTLALDFPDSKFGPMENIRKNSLSQGISEGISEKGPLSGGAGAKR